MSKKIAVITDSNSGITQSESKELGITVIPMPFMIDGVEYFEDITLSQEEFYEKLMGDCTISTSQPSPEVILNCWDETLKEYDEIVYIPLPRITMEEFRQSTTSVFPLLPGSL